MTKKLLKIFILISALVFSTQAQGQSNCDALIQQGLYDTYSESTSSSSYSQMVNNFCSSYSQYLNNQYDSSESDENSGSDSSINGNSNSVAGSVGFMGFGASAGYSTSNLNGQSSSYSNANSESLSTGQIQAIAGFLCTGNSDTQASSGSLQELSSVIDPAVLSAYNECLAQSQAGLQVSTTIQGDQNQVTITVYYEAPIGAPDEITLDAITISPSGSWSCSGSLWNAIPDDSDAGSSGTSLTNNALGMTCSRTISSTNMSYLGQSVYAAPSSITIFTSAGTVLRSFAPIYASPPVSLVGTNIQETCSDFNLYYDSVLTILSANCQSNSGANIANSIELLNCPGFGTMLDNQIFASAYSHDILSDLLFQQSVSNYGDWIPSNMTLVGTTLTGTFVCHGCTNWAFGVNEGGVATNAEEEIMSDLSDYFQPQTLSIDLSNFISNHDGYLVCNF